jgi:hypothetical protein
LVDLAARWHDLFQDLHGADISKTPVIILGSRMVKSLIVKSPNDFEIALRLMHFHPILTAQGRAPETFRETHRHILCIFPRERLPLCLSSTMQAHANG